MFVSWSTWTALLDILYFLLRSSHQYCHYTYAQDGGGTQPVGGSDSTESGLYNASDSAVEGGRKLHHYSPQPKRQTLCLCKAMPLLASTFSPSLLFQSRFNHLSQQHLLRPPQSATLNSFRFFKRPHFHTRPTHNILCEGCTCFQTDKQWRPRQSHRYKSIPSAGCLRRLGFSLAAFRMILRTLASLSTLSKAYISPHRRGPNVPRRCRQNHACRCFIAVFRIKKELGLLALN